LSKPSPTRVLVESARLRVRRQTCLPGIHAETSSAPTTLYAHMEGLAQTQWLGSPEQSFAPRMAVAARMGTFLRWRSPNGFNLLIVELQQAPAAIAGWLMAPAPRYQPGFEHWCQFVLAQSAMGSLPESLDSSLLDLLNHALTPSDSEAQALLRSLSRFVDTRLAFDLAVEDLARHLGCSMTYLVRLLREQAGTTPLAFIIGRRLEHARALLADTGLPLVEIALACGFSSQSHFGNSFKKAFEVTPAQYREQCVGR
jgi:AraC-like DNA-binding protein